MAVEMRSTQRRVRIDLRRLRRDAQRLLDAVGCRDHELSILLTDDRQMARLHQYWMDLSGPTDVMSFEGDAECPKMERPLLGDIAISAETAARRRPADPQREALRYLTHGLLHLVGLDPRTRAQRLRMNRKTRELLRQVGR